MKIMVLNGPNLNLLGTREVSVYGAETLSGIERMVAAKAAQSGTQVDFFQSNHEGEIVERIHAVRSEAVDGIIINPAAFTHTSVAIRDALLAVAVPFVEVHISNVAAREEFRQVNYFSDVAAGTIAGFGCYGYVLALDGLERIINADKD